MLEFRAPSGVASNISSQQELPSIFVMPDPDRHPESDPPSTSLEEFLNPPDSDRASPTDGVPNEQSGDEPTAMIEPSEPFIRQNESPVKRPDTSREDMTTINNADELVLFDRERYPTVRDESVQFTPESDRDTPDDRVIDKPDTESEIDKVARLESLLELEFRDTLAGSNAFTFPIGLLFTILGVLGWFLNPILDFIGFENVLNDPHVITRIASSDFTLADLAMIISTVFVLAGLHLIFYWVIHRISNLVKSRELDRLIEERRINNPCRHLDCCEDNRENLSSDGWEPIVGFLEEDKKSEPGITMTWRCGLFDMDLEESPICVVCDMYDPDSVEPPDLDPELQHPA